MGAGEVRMKSRLLKIDDIKINPNIYPRGAFDSSVVEAYKMAMDGGAEFPPILVGTINGDKSHYLVDGKHRMAANERRGEAYISADIRHFENAKDAFMEAVRLNTTHGAPLSWDDRAEAMKKLMAWGIKKERILQIVRIPTSEMFRVKAAMSSRVKTTGHRGKSRRGPSIAPSSPSLPSPSSVTYPDSPIIHDDQIGLNALEHFNDILVTGRLDVSKPKIADLSRRVWELLGKKLGVKA